MNILITESQVKVLSELLGDVAKETEILYRDKDIVCLIPKSQMTSRLFGRNANWCQRDKAGFEMWSKSGLLIRFLFRGGRKIRFTYFYEPYGNAERYGNKEADPNDGFNFRVGDYYWSNEKGAHLLRGSGNPFDAKSRRERDSILEKDILNLMNKIPQNCKDNVLRFIDEHKKGYDYCYKEKEFYTKREIMTHGIHNSLFDFIDQYDDIISSYHRKNQNFYFNSNYDSKLKLYELVYTFDYDSEEKNKNLIKNTFRYFNDFKSKFLEIIEVIKNR
jgi:hypothetical protein